MVAFPQKHMRFLPLEEGCVPALFMLISTSVRSAEAASTSGESYLGFCEAAKDVIPYRKNVLFKKKNVLPQEGFSGALAG